jgi:hypothetical protein
VGGWDSTAAQLVAHVDWDGSGERHAPWVDTTTLPVCVPLPASGYPPHRVSLLDNRAMWSRWVLRPRVLVDVSRVDTAVKVLGAHVCTRPPTHERELSSSGVGNHATLSLRTRDASWCW